MNIHLSDTEYLLVMDAIRVSIGRFQQHAKYLRESAATGGNPMLSAESASLMAEDYEFRCEKLVALSAKMSSQR